MAGLEPNAGIPALAEKKDEEKVKDNEMEREIGGDEARALKASGLLFVVRRCEIDYRQPARLDDLLDVRRRIAENKHRVYRDRECIAGLEDFLCRAARGEPIGDKRQQQPLQPAPLLVVRED